MKSLFYNIENYRMIFGSAVGPEGNIIGSCILHCGHEVTTNRACYQFEIADTEP